jgi:hypothetical protein
MEHQLFKFCRCCLSQANQNELKNMQEIIFKNDCYNGETKFTSIYDGYLICSGVSYDEFSLTKNVCEPCAEKLKSFYTFNVQCRKSNDILRKNYGVLPEIKDEKLDEEQENYIIYNDVSETNNFAQVFVNDNLTAKILPVYVVPEQLTEHNSDEMVDDCDDRFSGNDDVCDVKAGVMDEEELPHRKKSKLFNEIKVKPMKTEKKSKKSKSSKSLAQVEINDPSIDNLTPYDVDDFVKNWEKGQYICFFCDEFSASYIQYVEHRKKTHTFDAGMVKVERICNLCSVQTSGYVSHLTVSSFVFHFKIISLYFLHL